MTELRASLFSKIKTLNETVWEQQVSEPLINAWLENFDDVSIGSLESQRIHALYLLSRFMYFGRREMRELLHSLFRDLYKYRVVETIRRANQDTTDTALIDSAFVESLRSTRFMGVGNPSESGTHLLYYFRQENGLSSELFLNSHEIFSRSAGAPSALKDPSISRYVFIDDFCGSGTQALKYSSELVEDIKRINPNVEVAYYVLFANEAGLETVRQSSAFDLTDAVFTLDESFQAFGASSRYFGSSLPEISKDFAAEMCEAYGRLLWPLNPLGFADGQLLLGFFHNTPDNTLPVIWYSHQAKRWNAIFKRYPKLYNWGGI